MKTLSKTKSIRSRPVVLAAIVVSAIAPAFSAHCGTASDTLLITENSDTSLSVTWNGSSITPTLVADDHWTFNLPIGVFLGGERPFGSPNGASIAEPGGSSVTGPWNNVFDTATTQNLFPTLVDVQSDSSTTTGIETVLADGVAGNVGADSSGNAVYLTFHDVGDGTVTPPGAPDNASTALLTLVSAVILFGAARFRAAKAN